MKSSQRIKESLTTLVHSIRFRLVGWFTLILAIILGVFSIFIFIKQSHDLQYDALLRLESKITTMQENMHVTMMSGNPEITLPVGALQEMDVFVWIGVNGQVYSSQGPISVEEVVNTASQVLSGEPQYWRPSSSYVSWVDKTSVPKSPYLFVLTSFQGMPLRTGFVIMGTPLDPYGIHARLFLTLVAGSLITLTIALLGGFWLADRAMRPVKTITNTARTISETDLNKRLNLKSRDELGKLAQTFDAMLARLQTAFNRQRQFVADASHELRTPLTIVNLETGHALASRRSLKEYQRSLNVIRAENDFMTRLVNDLLTLARMDAGQANVQMEPVDLSTVSLDVLDRMVGLASRNEIRLEAGDLPEARILGDRQYLAQMITNLIDNAIKYSSGKNCLVRVETGVNDDHCWVRVSDTGPGIAAEHIPHIFERFYRVDKSRSRNPDLGNGEEKTPVGSGLGLSIVKWIAEVHHGEVKVESTPGQGTSFEVKFKSL